MSITIGVWLAAIPLTWVTALFLISVTLLLGNALMVIGSQIGVIPPLTGMWIPPWSVAWPIMVDLQYLAATVAIVADTSLRFDRIAGRMTEGEVAIAFSDLIYGRPLAPVYVGPTGEAIAPPVSEPFERQDDRIHEPTPEDAVSEPA